MSRGQICAQCSHFTLKDENGPLPQAAHGIGRCHGYDGHVAPVEPYVRWDARTCVLFGKAPDMAKRLQWIEMRKRKEVEDVAAAGAQPQGGANGSDRLRSHAPIETNAATRLLA